MRNVDKNVNSSSKVLRKDRKIIKEILSNMSPEARFILASREIEELSFKEIALLTGMRAEDVCMHSRELKEELRRQLFKSVTQ